MGGRASVGELAVHGPTWSHSTCEGVKRMMTTLSTLLLLLLSTVTLSHCQFFGSDWSLESGSGLSQQPTCVSIPSNMSLCSLIGYNRMRLPNLLDHDTLLEVEQQAKSWVPLVNIRCHEDARLFLCSLFAPVCLERPIYPCRSLCQKVKAGCEGVMHKYGFPWPTMLDCDKFPLDNDMCITSQVAAHRPREQQQRVEQQVPRQHGGQLQREGEHQGISTINSDHQQQVDNNDDDSTTSAASAGCSDLWTPSSSSSASTITDVEASDVCDSKTCPENPSYEFILGQYCQADFVMKLRLKRSVSGNRKRSPILIGRRSKTLFKTWSTSESSSELRLLRRPRLLLDKESKCCLQSITERSKKQRYLIMGEKKGQKLVASLVIPWSQSNQSLRRARRMFRRIDCQSMVQQLMNSDDQEFVASTRSLRSRRLPRRRGEETRPRSRR